MKQLPGLNPEYRKLWTASSVANFGDGVALTAAPLLAAALTRDPLLVAGLSFAHTIPGLLFSLPSGALVDRLDRRSLMGSVNVVRAALVGMLGLLIYLGLESLSLLYAVFFVLGALETLFDNASVAILPAVVPREGLERANSRLLGAELLANKFAGPPVGGLLFGTAAAFPFLLDAGTYAAAAALVLTMRGKFRATGLSDSPKTTSLRTEIGEGLMALWNDRLLRGLAAVLGVVHMAYIACFSILVLFAQEILGLGSVGFGILLSSGVVGGVTGSLVSDRLIGALGTGRALFWVLLLTAATSAVIALAHDPYLVGTMIALNAFSAVVWKVILVSQRQAAVPGRLLGRVNSAYRLIGLGSMSAGALLGGLIARGFGLAAPFWAASVVLTIVAFASLSLPFKDSSD